MAKPPVPGTVKTRLLSLLTMNESARLYRAFLADGLLQYTGLGVAVRVYLAGSGEKPALDVPCPDASVHRQRGSSLGARMDAAFRDSEAAGFNKLVIIGMDHPTLPSRYIQEAFAALAEPGSAVIGPSDDGGFYLLGMCPYHADLLLDRKFSHAGVFRETLALARRLPVRVTVLPPWYDVDTPDDLRRLARELEDSRVRVPETRRVVADLARKYPGLASPAVFTVD